MGLGLSISYGIVKALAVEIPRLKILTRGRCHVFSVDVGKPPIRCEEGRHEQNRFCLIDDDALCPRGAAQNALRLADIEVPSQQGHFVAARSYHRTVYGSSVRPWHGLGATRFHLLSYAMNRTPICR